MANPNNAVGTNGAFGGRTSVNAFNDVLSAFSGRGIVSGWGCSPSNGLTVQLGGNGTDRDVAIAEDGSGNKTTVNNISQAPVQVTVNPAPASNSRVDAIVAYIEDSPQGSGVTDNPDVVNLLVVSGTVASNPIVPNDNTIRTAITADGASGSTAYYVVLAQVTITNGTTDIDATMISAGTKATLTTPLSTGLVKANMIDFATIGLGENYLLDIAVSLPNTASNGHNTIFSTGQKNFSGGVYMLSLPSLMVSLNASGYQAYVGYTIDGNFEQVLNFSQMGTDQTLAGPVSFNVPIELSSGNHTVTIEVGTNNADKRITVANFQNEIKVYLVKIGM